MNNQSAHLPFVVITALRPMPDSHKSRSSKTLTGRQFRITLSIVLVLATSLFRAATAQQATSKYSDGVTIKGTVLGYDGKPVSDAVVSLEEADSMHPTETKTNAAGAFTFSSLPTGSYRLSAEKSGSRSRTINVNASMKNGLEKIDLVLQGTGLAQKQNSSSAPLPQAMEFADQTNFTVAGVTDWTAIGGHGSDSTLRTSESLASETLALKPESSDHNLGGAQANATEERESESKLRAILASTPDSFDANRRLGKLYLRDGKYSEAVPLLERANRIDPSNTENQYELALAYEASGDLSQSRECVRKLMANQQNADLYRLAGELDEKLGDPLSAVHEYEQAVKLNPSEQNYFEWGSELLLHRAVWQAQQVFQKGADAFPKSARMQTALGAAFFAGARYDEAARRLCDASDLNPTDPNPYIFMGKIQMAAPDSLPCVQPKLARFVQQQPASSIANYLYAMAILKHQELSPDKQAVQQAEALLTKAVAIDSKCSEAYLQLGIIAASQRDFSKAIAFYTKAIAADPQLADAHYRLGVAYDRTGQSDKAKQEFQLHDQIAQQHSEDTERQRRAVKQFLIVQPGNPATPGVQ